MYLLFSCLVLFCVGYAVAVKDLIFRKYGGAHATPSNTLTLGLPLVLIFFFFFHISRENNDKTDFLAKETTYGNSAYEKLLKHIWDFPNVFDTYSRLELVFDVL